MLLLISGATKALSTCQSRDNIGVLIGPRKTNSIDNVLATGLPWAADNDCFNTYNPDLYITLMQRIKGKQRLLFITAPDVVANAEETLRRFYLWESVLQGYCLPIAYVGQDGITNYLIPWHSFDAFFIGGTTEWKLSTEAADLVKYAKSLGKWVHMGRVNSQRRLKYAMSIGCDSVDGTGYSKFNYKIHRDLRFIAYHERQSCLFG